MADRRTPQRFRPGPGHLNDAGAGLLGALAALLAWWIPWAAVARRVDVHLAAALLALGALMGCVARREELREHAPEGEAGAGPASGPSLRWLLALAAILAFPAATAGVARWLSPRLLPVQIGMRPASVIEQEAAGYLSALTLPAIGAGILLAAGGAWLGGKAWGVLMLGLTRAVPLLPSPIRKVLGLERRVGRPAASPDCGGREGDPWLRQAFDRSPASSTSVSRFQSAVQERASMLRERAARRRDLYGAGGTTGASDRPAGPEPASHERAPASSSRPGLEASWTGFLLRRSILTLALLLLLAAAARLAPERGRGAAESSREMPPVGSGALRGTSSAMDESDGVQREKAGSTAAAPSDAIPTVALLFPGSRAERAALREALAGPESLRWEIPDLDRPAAGPSSVRAPVALQGIERLELLGHLEGWGLLRLERVKGLDGGPAPLQLGPTGASEPADPVQRAVTAAAWGESLWDGHWLAIPLTVEPLLLFIDPQALAEAGLQAPEPDEGPSWSDLVDWARRLSPAAAQGLVAVGPGEAPSQAAMAPEAASGPSSVPSPAARRMGVAASTLPWIVTALRLAPSGSAAHIDPLLAAEALKAARQLFEASGGPEGLAGGLGPVAGWPHGLFAEGRAAAVAAPSGFARALAVSRVWDRYAVTQLPRPDDTPPLAVAVGWSVVAPAGLLSAPHWEDAEPVLARALKRLAAPDVQRALAAAAGALPAIPGAQVGQLLAEVAATWDAPRSWAAATLAAGRALVPWPDELRQPESRAVVETALRAALAGSSQPPWIAQEVVRALDSLLRRRHLAGPVAAASSSSRVASSSHSW